MTARHDLLLLSSSPVHGGEHVDAALEMIEAFLDGRQRLVFVPFAEFDRDAYTTRVQHAFAPLGVEVIGLHASPDPVAAVRTAEVLFVGGGNTFRLLRSLQDLRLIEPVRDLVGSGNLGYLGASAGSNMACPTLRTTNDMPIVSPLSFEAFGLIPFQINAHYSDPLPSSTHQGETREQRITEFLQENDVPVLGMREGSWLIRSGDSLTLGGAAGARLMRQGAEPAEYAEGDDLSFLLHQTYRFDSPLLG